MVYYKIYIVILSFTFYWIIDIIIIYIKLFWFYRQSKRPVGVLDLDLVRRCHRRRALHRTRIGRRQRTTLRTLFLHDSLLSSGGSALIRGGGHRVSINRLWQLAVLRQRRSRNLLQSS